NSSFRGKERAMAFAIWGSTIGGMAAVGPLLGGWLTTDFSWRWAFGVNVPFGVLVIIGLLFTVAESSAAERASFDLVGAALTVLGAGSLVFGLIQGRELGWWSTDEPLTIGAWSWPFEVSPIPHCFVLAAIAIAAFILWERRRTEHGRSTMIPLDLFRIPSCRNGNIVAMIISLGELGMLFVLPLWLQN